jgi:hypothetical protein
MPLEFSSRWITSAQQSLAETLPGQSLQVLPWREAVPARRHQEITHGYEDLKTTAAPPQGQADSLHHDHHTAWSDLFTPAWSLS